MQLIPTMQTGIQIKTFLIPRQIWDQGHCFVRNGESLQIEGPARVAHDALDIERRLFQKRLNLQNESRRYSQCCERIQQLAMELFTSGANIEQPTVWLQDISRTKGIASAVALVAYTNIAQAITERASRAIRTSDTEQIFNNIRLNSIFVPPDYRKGHMDSLKSSKILMEKTFGDRLFEEAALRASTEWSGASISAAEIKQAFDNRLALAGQCLKDDLGLIDVFEYI